MPRSMVLLAMAAMLAMAGASPGLVVPNRSLDGLQSGTGVPAAFSPNWCYNCSDLTNAPGVVSVTLQSSMSSPSTNSYAVSALTGSLYVQEEMWLWRGKVRSRWESLGFDSSTFEMFISMKGAKTRINLLLALSEPKDRMRLAQELGLDWKAVDYQVVRLAKCGLVDEDRAFGKVKLFRLTRLGEILLGLLKREFNMASGTRREMVQAPSSTSG
jgi:hypothetical protein